MAEKTHSKSLIMGLGKTGFSCADFFAKRNIYFRVADNRMNPPNLEAFKQNHKSVDVYLGDFDNLVIDDMETIVVSPGISSKESIIQDAIKKNKEVISDIELFFQHVNAPVVAITGSNGKSTVTELVGKMINDQGMSVAVGGNLGVPALDLLSLPQQDFYVLEISSFQLDLTLKALTAASAVLNISADHMDRYESIEEYAASKKRIYEHANICIVNKDDPIVCKMIGEKDNVIYFTSNNPAQNEFGLIRKGPDCWLAYGDEVLMEISELKTKGNHNALNALAALSLGRAIGLTREGMIESIREFQGLPHRCQFLLNNDGINWFNDSKATNVAAAVASISGMDGEVVLIAGGDGKGADFALLKDVVSEKVKLAILIGKDANLIADKIAECTQVMYAVDMENAVTVAKQYACPGDNILLAPACSSLDMYLSYEKRGEDFVFQVNKINNHE